MPVISAIYHCSQFLKFIRNYDWNFLYGVTILKNWDIGHTRRNLGTSPEIMFFFT